MATVYLAEDLKHRRKVAVKVLKPEVARAVGPERFLREIEIAAGLNHPHVVALFDSGAAGDRLYYVMPFIEGESLRERLTRETQLPVDEALRLTREIASALGHAHQRGLVHRDIKPENVLLTEGIALVADFGIARALRAARSDGKTQALTEVGTVVGTPRYMSPEQVSGEEIDGRSDIYALACVLYEMLAGMPPFVAPTTETLLRMHLALEARPVTELRPSVPGAVSLVIAKALSKVPADRYASAAGFAEALLAAAGAGATGVSTRDGDRARFPNNLPKQRNRFIGREKEKTECARLLEESRLVTLTGVGGCGKTRLALEIAGNLLVRYPDGAWLVDLAPLTEAERVPEAAAASLRVREESGKDLGDTLRRHVAGKQLLLLMDNCEHLLDACARLIDGLLGAGEGVHVLATSREGLGVDGERVFPLRSLPVPAKGAGRDLHAVEASDAVQLFLDRARVAAHDFSIGEENAAAIAEICHRLDGIPLAIELAAARVKILSVEQIRDKLDDRFRLLTGGSKTALPRHQTLQAALQWSYDQLHEAEQRCLRALSVFAAGWTLAAASRVVEDEADEFEVMDLLARLVDKSLVLVDRGAREPRYSLLETVRQYARERLIEAGEAEAVRRRHLEEFIALGHLAYPERFVREEQWSSALELEHDNLRAALEVARQNDPERHLELAGTLIWFWHVRSHWVEAREHLTGALAATSPDPPRPARARALMGAANVLSWQGESAVALPLMQEALRMWRELGDVEETALALEGIGWVQFLAGDEEAAQATFEECYRLQKEGNDPVLVNRAMVALAQVLVARHEVERARSLASDIIAFSSARGDRRNEHFGWHFLADCALIEGKCEESLELYQKSLVLAEAIGDRVETGFEVQGVAMSLAGLGDHEKALRLATATQAEWERLSAQMRVRFWDELMERYLGPGRSALGGKDVERIAGEGWRLPFEEAVGLALQPRQG